MELEISLSLNSNIFNIHFLLVILPLYSQQFFLTLHLTVRFPVPLCRQKTLTYLILSFATQNKLICMSRKYQLYYGVRDWNTAIRGHRKASVPVEGFIEGTSLLVLGSPFPRAVDFSVFPTAVAQPVHGSRIAVRNG